MPRPAAPDTLMLTFREAARLLSINAVALRRLIAQGHIKAHPILADRITRTEIERFALNYEYAETDNRPDTNPTHGRPVDPITTPEGWQVPQLRLRENSGGVSR